MKKKQYPNIKNIEPTNFCNFNCPVCVEKTPPRGFLELDLLEKIISHNQKILEGQSIWLHYRGEPLMHKGLFEIIKKLDQVRVETRLSTNGFLLNQENIEKTLSSNLKAIVISLVTLDPKRYQELRGNSYLSIVKNNLLNLVKQAGKIKSKLKIQVMGLNYGLEEETTGFINYFHQQGIEVAIHRYSTRLGKSRYQPKGVNLPSKVKRYPCHWLFNDMIILFDGRVTTCYYDLGGQMIIGNLKDFDYSIRSLWNSQEYNLLRNSHKKLLFKGVCKNCVDWVYGHPQLKNKFKSYVTIYPVKGKSYQL